MNDRDLVDETVLRRALRLEADERVPIFDPAALAGLAGRDLPTARSLLLALAPVLVTGLAAGTIWSAVADRAPDIADAVTAGALDLLIGAATLLVPVAQIAAQPAVPLSLLAALGVAIVHELRERKEHVHVHAS